MKNINRSDVLALIISLAAVLAVYIISDRLFEQMPHIEDEMAYVWQAQVFAEGKLTLPSPPGAASLTIPYVVDYQGQRFAKYPPGWPIMLALGLKLNARSWVNPVLAGFSIWFIYVLGKRLFGQRVALFASFLTLLSPFFLFNAAMLFPHTWTLFLSLAFIMAWLDTLVFSDGSFPKPISAITAGLSLGVLAFTRPLTAIGVCLPFVFHAILLLYRGERTTRIRVVVIGLLAGLLGGIIFIWQFAVTGDALLNPYTLWWPYDKVGFGNGYGILESGYSLGAAVENLRFSFDLGSGDFFGWGDIWWFFPLVGLLQLRKNNLPVWLVVSVFPSLVFVYMAYWTYTPRYYYEGLFSLNFLCSLGVLWLIDGGFKNKIFNSFVRTIAIVVCSWLFCYNLLIYLPTRFHEMKNLYGINRALLLPFKEKEAQAMTPALVIVYPDSWGFKYGGLLELQNAELTTPFIFAAHRGQAEDNQLVLSYPERNIIYYYFDEPEKFYTHPR
ncbi:MAG: glycosyltransferase family 39 protein [Anaerolineales bacterium]|jgi:4-amino-4-deoxy-L-arabinose transferase-like glycosyltransferase|nr:glycosyltransferase family 39 protein [Anaerolineales bacterium]